MKWPIVLKLPAQSIIIHYIYVLCMYIWLYIFFNIYGASASFTFNIAYTLHERHNAYFLSKVFQKNLNIKKIKQTTSKRDH